MRNYSSTLIHRSSTKPRILPVPEEAMLESAKFDSPQPAMESGPQPTLSNHFVCATCRENVFSPSSFSRVWGTSDGLQGHRTASDGLKYCTTIKDARANATAGCNWCSLLLPILENAKQSEFSRAAENRTGEREFSVALSFTRNFLAPEQSSRNALSVEIDDVFTNRLQVHAYAGKPPCKAPAIGLMVCR